MDLYKKNLEILSSQFSKMDVLIEKARDNMDDSIHIIREQSLDGREIVKVQKGDRKCYLSGKRNTIEPVEKWLEKLGDLSSHTRIFMMGLGNSLYLSELIKKTEEKIVIVVFEPSIQIFIDFLEHTDITGWFEKHSVLFYVNGIEGMELENMRFAANRLLVYEMLPYYKNFVLPNYELLFQDEALEFLKICRKAAMDEIVLRNTKKLFSGVMAKNLFSNAKYLLDGYKTTQLIQVIPNDTVGIVVAAGPSLNKNIKDLKEACGKAMIIAVDTAVKPLIKEGIRPDMVMIIDARKPLELVQIEGIKDIPLVSTINAASEVMDYHTGKKYFFHENYAFAETILRRSKEFPGGLDTGGSVATNAFSLLHKIELNTIILVGQDLAYTNNRAYADGTFEEKMQEVNTKGMSMVEGNYEDKVPTAPDLKRFLDWYNYIIPAIKEINPDFCVINATEGGAKITGTEIMTLKEAIKQKCKKKINIRECLDQLNPMLDHEQRQWAVEYLKSFPDECRRLEAQAKKIKKSYQKIDKICRRKRIDHKEYVNALKRIEKEIPKIEAMPMYQIAELSLSDAKYIINTEQYMHENTMKKEGREIARKGILYMDLVAQCGEIFRQYTEEIYKDLK